MTRRWNRLGRVRKIHHCQADEDHPPEWILERRAAQLPADSVRTLRFCATLRHSLNERTLYRYKNLLDSAQAIILACRKLGVDPEDPGNRINADIILEYRIDSDPSNVLSPEIALAIESLWHDPIIPSVMDQSSEFYLMDSAT